MKKNNLEQLVQTRKRPEHPLRLGMRCVLLGALAA